MSLAYGTRLGPYEILAPLGAGGRGETLLGGDPHKSRPLFWVGSSSTTVDLFPDGRVIFDSMIGCQNLRQYDLEGQESPRWIPDGKHILFTGQDEKGLDGVFIQSFTRGKDKSVTRRPFAGFDPGWITESLGLSPAGCRLVLSEADRVFSLMIAEGVPDSIAGGGMPHESVRATESVLSHAVRTGRQLEGCP